MVLMNEPTTFRVKIEIHGESGRNHDESHSFAAVYASAGSGKLCGRFRERSQRYGF
jgi:hypothetical protein